MHLRVAIGDALLDVQALPLMGLLDRAYTGVAMAAANPGRGCGVGGMFASGRRVEVANEFVADRQPGHRVPSESVRRQHFLPAAARTRWTPLRRS